MTIKMVLLYLLLAGVNRAYCNEDSTVFIGGKITGIKNAKIHLTVINKFRDDYSNEYNIIEKEIDKQGRFSFREIHNRTLDFRVQLYVTIKNDNGYLLSARWGIICPGDSIWVDAEVTEEGVKKIKYTGRGWEVFQCWNEMDSIINNNNLAASPLNIEQIIDECEYLIEKKTRVINKYSGRIAYAQQRMLEADMLGDTRMFYHVKMLACINIYRRPMLPYDDIYILTRWKMRDTLNPFLVHSHTYLRFLIQQDQFEAMLAKPGDYRVPIADFISKAYSSYKGKMLERILFKIILMNNRPVKGSDINTLDSLHKVALASIEDTSLKSYLNKTIVPKIKGTLCFPFSFEDTSGNLVNNEHLKGKVVVIDVWYTGCGGCSGYSKRLDAHIYPKFVNDSNVVFLSICGDKKKTTWMRSIYSGQYTRPENLNVYTAGRAFHDTFLKYYQFNGGPYSMILDKQGKIFAGMPPTNDMELLEQMIRQAAEQN